MGGAAATYLAAAGIGRLILAHGGDIKPSDLNRQTLMTDGAIGTSRVQCARQRLLELNPRLAIEAVAEYVTTNNVESLVRQADLVVDAAPIFSERLLMNEQSVRQRKPMVECAMYELEAQITTFRPGATACLACLYPADPPAWNRRFPVFGAVAGMVGCLGAMEAIKVLTGLGEPLYDRLLTSNLRDMTFRTVKIAHNPRCPVCGGKET